MRASNLKAVILAGDYRGPLGCFTDPKLNPKFMARGALSAGTTRILDFHLQSLQQIGLKKVYIPYWVGHDRELKNIFGDGRRGLEISWQPQDGPLGTADSMIHAVKTAGDEIKPNDNLLFLCSDIVLPSDDYCDIFNKMLTVLNETRDANLVMAVNRVPLEKIPSYGSILFKGVQNIARRNYGELPYKNTKEFEEFCVNTARFYNENVTTPSSNPQGIRVIDAVEKPSTPQLSYGNLQDMSIYLFRDAEVFMTSVAEQLREEFDFNKHFLTEMIRMPHKYSVYGIVFSDDFNWHHIDSEAELFKLDRRIASGMFDSASNEKPFKGGKCGANLVLGENVTFGKNFLIGNNVNIGDGAHIGDGTVIQSNVLIGKGSKIVGSTIASQGEAEIRIGENSTITNCYVAASIKPNSTFENRSVVPNMLADARMEVKELRFEPISHVSKLNPDISDINESLKLSADFIRESGIQNKESGCFVDYFEYDGNDYKFNYMYPEINGYGITTLIYLLAVLPDIFEGTDKIREELVENARMAVNGLVKKTQRDFVYNGVEYKGYVGRYSADLSKRLEADSYDAGTERMYVFDNAMILNGLMNLYRLTGDSQYMHMAQGIVKLFKGVFKKGNGMYTAAFDYVLGKPSDSHEKWSLHSGGFHSKLLIGLLNFYNRNKDAEIKEDIQELVKATKGYQDPKTGRIALTESNQPTYMHPHLYSAEGLLVAGVLLKDESALKAAGWAVEWTLKHQKESGGVPRHYNPKTGEFSGESSDIIAQTLRLASALHQLGSISDKINGNPIDQILENLKNRLLSFQIKKDDSRLIGEHSRFEGGFLYGYEFDQTEKNTPNSWCTMFAIQALDYYRKWKLNLKIDLNNYLFI